MKMFISTVVSMGLVIYAMNIIHRLMHLCSTHQDVPSRFMLCCLGTVCRKGDSFKVEFSTWEQQICLKPGSVVLFSPWPIPCYQKGYVCVCVEGAGGRLI